MDGNSCTISKAFYSSLLTTQRAVLDGLLHGLTVPQLPFHTLPGDQSGEGRTDLLSRSNSALSTAIT